MRHARDKSPQTPHSSKGAISTDTCTPDDSQHGSMDTRSQEPSALPSSPTPAYMHNDATNLRSSNTSSSNDNKHASKYASLGLNRRPLYLSHPHKPAKSTMSPRPTTYQRKWMKDEEDDLEELRDIMVFQYAEPRGYDSGWQAINGLKWSGYTTGMLTTSGWRPGEGAGGSGCQDGQVEMEQVGDEGGVENSDQQDDGGEAKDSESESELEICDEQAQDRSSKMHNDKDTPWLDDKYFDYDGYLKFIKSCIPPRKSSRQRKAAEPLCMMRRRSSSNTRLHSRLPPAKDAAIAKPSKGTVKSKRRPSKEGANLDGKEKTPPLSTFQQSRPASKSALEEANEHSHMDMHMHMHMHSHSPTPTPAIQPDKWELASGTSSSPVRIGIPSPEKLTIRLQDGKTRRVKTLTYPDSAMDWHSNTAVYALNCWRAHALRDHRLTPKTTWVPYAPEQDAWLVLLHRKIQSAVEDGAVVKLPGAGAVAEAMNAFFAGKVFMDARERVLPQRELRDESSVRGKLKKKGTEVWMLRDVTRRLLGGKKGGKVYVPGIGDEEVGEMVRERLEKKYDVKECDDTVGHGKDVEGRMLEAVFGEENKENKEGYGLSSM